MSNGEVRFKRQDWMAAGLFFAVGLMLRMPFRSHLAYHWDGAQFALAIENYNIRISQPHAPGYFLYVMLGRLVNLFVGEPHASLVWLSVIAGAALTAIGFLLATAMFGRGVGSATAVILATSPLCWFHSEIALTSIVDAALVTALVLACWTAVRHSGRWGGVIWISLLFAAVAGVRQQSGAALLPVWCYTLLKLRPPRWPKVLSAVLLTGFFCALWFVPMVRTTGGVAAYLDLVRAKNQYHAPQAPWGGGGVDALLMNVSMIGRACWVGLLLAALISVSEFLYWVFRERTEIKRQLYREHAEQLCLLILWIVPMLAFWLAMYVTTPGYVLCFFPGLATVAAIAAQRVASRLTKFLESRMVMTERWRRLAAASLIFGSIAVANGIVFIRQPNCLERALVDLPLTAVEIRQHDRKLAACFQIIREKFRPEDVVICHGNQFFYWGFRQFEYHLAEYRNVLLMPDASLSNELQDKRWMGQWRQTTFISSTDDLATVSILLVVPPQESVQLFQPYFNLSTAELLAKRGISLYVLRQHF